ncbi:MAG: hypothetical protein EOO38_22795 [Cytophagaceae bacterium]|nr:MAG: hypothetical protein EOO38_22795 [Cytophagaceae bacterium]
MTTRDKIVRARTMIGTMTGFFAGFMAPKFVDWGMLPKAALAMAVTGVIIPLMWAVLPKR